MALSDLHADYEPNRHWAAGLSLLDYRSDILILAGDVSNYVTTLREMLDGFVRRFRCVLFVPGNHELWVHRPGSQTSTSVEKFSEVQAIVRESGASMQTLHMPGLRIVPLLGWYDYSFGAPSEHLYSIWMDYHACRWPSGWGAADSAAWLRSCNRPETPSAGEVLITFSHFLPRIDLMPENVPQHVTSLYPVLGSTKIDTEIRRLGAAIHVYGHSHLNSILMRDGIRYVNNAFGYPQETSITRKHLICIHEYA